MLTSCLPTIRRRWRTIIRRSLESLVISSITEASDGVEALEACSQQQQFTLVLTDWNMPNKNGLEVIQEIRSRNVRVPIIMITTEAGKTPDIAGDRGRRHRLPYPSPSKPPRSATNCIKHGCN